MIGSSQPLDDLEKSRVRRTPSAKSKLQVIFPSLRPGSVGGGGGRGEESGAADSKCLAKRVQSAYRYIKQHSIEVHD